MANALNVIHPYKWQGLWVFDDARVGLDKEPFVEGTDALIDKALAVSGIPEPDKGFRLLFGSGPFPNYDFKLQWLREGEGGNWYRAEDFGMDGWLCPALLRYFDAAPQEIYVRFEARGA
jgi:hypothetical protein